MLLTVENEVVGTVQNIKMKGVLDFSTVDFFDFVSETPDFVTEFNVDFSELDFIDSTGIGAILAILHTASNQKAKVNFNNMSEETKDLFDTIGVFEIKKSLLGED
jgi:anti-anti-sigma factor